MDINLDCIYCIIKKSDYLFSQYEENEDKKLKFMKDVFKIISMGEKDDTAPYLNTRIMRLLNKELNLGDIYYEIKKEYNKLLISMEEEIKGNIYSSQDNLGTALKYAMVGNFIDFGAMDKVDKNNLDKLIKDAANQEIDAKEYNNFLKELKKAKRIVYLCDNAGEIVFDKIFIKVIKEVYKDITIDVIVRGKPTLNDATIVDAQEVGLCNIVNVIGNGIDIPGTQLNEINEKSKEKIDSSDLIISKGQGNFETLFGCGKNIYYIFLCKCDLFTKRFNIEKFKGVFVNERNVKDRME
ncbi:damage-control phosphatase ARMT1 family protein [Clostridium sporogenes]|uniref:damage-control phosphatase ARMT1 family protein n=1 Tax=Clostridium sporogenes TaxID=1509 RepID=UPI0006B28069|nr:ARMT1-like domain-containing protein [Clostridium sporogenes]KOY67416.1 hypothetical protein AN649_03270 [Clostridium sporogenes]MDU1421147.1 ARMT1-like domain-containing protein [Clostridium botulinum]